MAKLDLRTARRIKCAAGEIIAIKGTGFSWDRLAERVREILGDSLRSMRYPTPDFAGLYQDAAGTLPVTAVGQPVGLMLDKRLGLVRGAEFQRISSWDSPPIVDGGLFLSLRQSTVAAVVSAGSWFEVHFTVSNYSGSGDVGVSGSAASWLSPMRAMENGTYRFIAKNTNETKPSSMTLFSRETNFVNFTGFSIRELPGNHAAQPTTTARPAYQAGPSRIAFDGVDDYLRTALPGLGSNVTIARSIPGTGAQILTGQTIAAGSWDDNVMSCATLVIDRALTSPETALVTAFLNQQAGV